MNSIRRGLRWLRRGGGDDAAPGPEAPRRRALLLRRVYPPDRPAEAVGQFGGLPRLPAGTDWPRHGRSGAPMTFLATIDLARLPVLGGAAALPPRGELLFFIAADGEDWCDDGEAAMGRVLHLPEGAGTAKKHAPPADALPCYGETWMYHFKRVASEPDAPRSFDRWLIEARAVDSYCAAPLDRDEDPSSADERAEDATRRNIEEAFEAYGRTAPKRRYHDGTDPLPREPYPQFWRMIEAAAGEIRFQAKFKLDARWDPPSGTARPAYVAALGEATAWAEEARAHDPWEQPSPEDRRRFRAWITDLDDRYYSPEEYSPETQKDVVLLVSGTGLAETMSEALDELTALDPARLRAAMAEAERLVAWRHAAVIDELGTMTVVAHQMLGWGTEVQDVVQRRQDDVLLLQLASDHGIRWIWGDCGVIQFWISPDDLANRRFDRVVTTFAGH